MEFDNSTMEEWNDGRKEEFDNEAIRRFDNGKMEEWNDGRMGRLERIRRFDNVIIRQWKNGMLEKWNPDNYRREC